MNNRTEIEEIETPAMKRRMYLLKKAVLGTWAAVTAIGAVLIGIMAVAGGVGHHWTVWLLFLSAFGSTAYLVSRLCRTSLTMMKSLPYVPPVHKQVASLPAPEVLLRGSDQPAALPGELLRAAREGSAESEKELLRAEGRSAGVRDGELHGESENVASQS